MHSHKCPEIRVRTCIAVSCIILYYLVLSCTILYCTQSQYLNDLSNAKWPWCQGQSSFHKKTNAPCIRCCSKRHSKNKHTGFTPYLGLKCSQYSFPSLTQAAQAFFFRPSWELCTSDNFASIFHEDSWSIPGNYAWPFHEGKDSTRHNCFSELSRADSYCTSHNSFWSCHAGSPRIQRNFVWLCHADKVCILHTWTWWIFRVGSQYIWNSSTWPCHENSRCIQYIAFWLSHVGKADKFDTCPFEKHRADSAQLASQSLLLWHSWPHIHQPFVPGAYTNASGHRLYSVLKQALEISGANALKLVRLV